MLWQAFLNRCRDRARIFAEEASISDGKICVLVLEFYIFRVLCVNESDSRSAYASPLEQGSRSAVCLVLVAASVNIVME